MTHCPYYRPGQNSGIFRTGYDNQCIVINTPIPDVRVTSHCTNDFFRCRYFKKRQTEEREEERRESNPQPKVIVRDNFKISEEPTIKDYFRMLGGLGR